MINYTDYSNLTMGEIMTRIRSEWLQTNKKLISVETLATIGKGYRIRVWWRE